MKSTKTAVTTKKIAEILRDKTDIALFSHTNPDGDTVGATIALCLALRKLGKNVSLFCDCPMRDSMQKFARTAEYSSVFQCKYQILVAVDCGDVFRLGEFSAIYDGFAETLTIDHHGGEYFSKYNCVLPYASTCQIVYEVVRSLGVEIDSEIATYLYMGLCTDTGNFSNSNTDKPSFLMAADMCELGADVTKVNRTFFQDTSLQKTKVLGRALSRIRTYFGGKLAIVFVTEKDLQECGADISASEGLVSYAIAVETTVAAVSLFEYKPNVFKVSMRGKNFNVRDVCKEFGGGGHLVASGCMISGYLEDVIERVVRVFSWTMEE